MAVNLPKIVETPNFSLHCKSKKENGNVTMTFPVNLSLGCFRTAALLMVTLNMESRKPMGHVYPENRFKRVKRGSANSLTWSVDPSLGCKLLFVFPLTNAQLNLTKRKMSLNGSANVKHS